MEKQQLNQLFNSFLANYDTEAKNAVWEKQSKQFHDFWVTKIMSGDREELNDTETDQIIKILDRNGKGNTKESEAVAKAMIPQGAWRRMFNEIKINKNLSNLLNSIFTEKDVDKRAELINEVYKLNEGHRNNLTGPSGNAINAMLAAFNPVSNLSVISLKDRRKVFEYFGFEGAPDFDKDSIGKKIIFSNIEIMRGFNSFGLNYSARTISDFLYSSEAKPLWKIEHEDDYAPWGGFKEVSVNKEDTTSEVLVDPSVFYMESQLEDFLIENWDRTELGQRYDLIEEEGELKSQQYQTGIGRIDILAQEKETKNYVVIELKKGKTSDDTVGQLARYMGWIEENKTNGKTVKGIIIASQYDERLYYALKKIKDTEVYLYKIDFKLQEFKK